MQIISGKSWKTVLNYSRVACDRLPFYMLDSEPKYAQTILNFPFFFSPNWFELVIKSL